MKCYDHQKEVYINQPYPMALTKLTKVKKKDENSYKQNTITNNQRYLDQKPYNSLTHVISKIGTPQEISPW